MQRNGFEGFCGPERDPQHLIWIVGWKLQNPRLCRRFQAPYNKSISRVSAGQMQSVLHHIHQRLGLRARRLLARSKDCHNWVQQQLKAAITTSPTVSNNCYEQLQTLSVSCEHHTPAQTPLLQKSPRATQTWQRRQISLIYLMSGGIRLFKRSCAHVICFYLLIRSAVPPQHSDVCVCVCTYFLKESDKWPMKRVFSIIFKCNVITATCQICVQISTLSHNQGFGLQKMTHEALWGSFCPSPFSYTWVIYLEVIFTIIALSLSVIPFISSLLLSFTFPPF